MPHDRLLPPMTLPAPGDAGWTPMEAAEALMGDKVARCWASSDPPGWFRRLAVDLLRLIRDRADMAHKGRDLGAALDAPRVRIPRDLFGTAALMQLDILAETIWLILPGGGAGRWLHAATVVRVVPPTVPPSYRKVAIMAADEARCRARIADLAEAHPHSQPQAKPALFMDAAARFAVSRRGFNRAWDSAAPTAWKAAGLRNRISAEN
jgi:hypothetical protein